MQVLTLSSVVDPKILRCVTAPSPGGMACERAGALVDTAGRTSSFVSNGWSRVVTALPPAYRPLPLRATGSFVSVN